MKLVFFGTPEFAVASLRALEASRHQVAAVVTQPDRPSGRSQKVEPSPVKKEAQGDGLPVFQPIDLSEPAFLSRLQAFQAELAVVVAYGKLLPPSLIQPFPKGAVNLHASVLPKYRGAAPIAWALIHGERETGVTVFQLDDELDHGPIIASERLTVQDDDDAVSLSKKLSRLGSLCLAGAIDSLADGTAAPQPQREDQASWAPRLKKEDGLIRWSLSAEKIRRLVRGVQPWPGAWTLWKGKPLKILAVSTEGFPGVPGAKPGTVVLSHPSEGLAVQTGQGRIKILKLQGPGGRALAFGDFLRGHPIPLGASFESVIV
ncbi:MAG: methionyl-tRNA formyltransferase [Candidatus Omnitrophica bacterium]|nr:methionyl-tRNA formyltransferase [Candidatus Omnitrophota bacterium]